MIKHNKGFLSIAIFLISLGLLVALLPERKANREISPRQMLLELTDHTRFLTADQIAEDLINHDPSLLLIDVRSKAEFDSFNIKGSIHIPLDSLLCQSTIKLLENPGLRKVFYSNDDIDAAQAWQIARRRAFGQLFILEGGVNNWFANIIKPEKPSVTASQNDFDLFSFRLAASQYFTGATSFFPETKPEPKTTAPKKVITAPVKKSAPAEGGC